MATIPNSPPIDALTDNAQLGAEVAGFAEVDAVLVGAVLVGAVLVGTLGLPDEVAGVDTVELPDALESELTGREVLTATLEPELVLDKINTRLAIVDKAFNCCAYWGPPLGVIWLWMLRLPLLLCPTTPKVARDNNRNP